MTPQRRYLAAGALVGAFVSLAAGYMAYKTARGTLGITGWMTSSDFGYPMDALFWAIGGALAGAALTFILRRDAS